jgi:hypothetical protein
MSRLSFINISERAYKYIRQFTIKSLEDAMIELLTNCIDAYRKTDITERYIYIDTYGGKDVYITDYALGLTSAEMASCFLQVGDYTASDSSRGFFSRGAKDVSAIGNLFFSAIKDNVYSQCQLNTDAYGAITVADVEVTDAIRYETGIPDPKNGLVVGLQLLPNFQNFSSDTLYNNICKTAVLRDIMSDPNNHIIMRSYDNTGNLTFDKRLTYEFPPSVTILDMEYIVPDYPDVTARFLVKRTDHPIAQPTKESQIEFGFLLKDGATIYEANTIDNKYRWNPSISYLHGYLECPAIRTYLREYDLNGATEKNPYPIIDPSRITGLNKMHPLIVSLFKIPLVRVDLILREMNSAIASKSVTLTDINELLDELSQMGIDLVKDNDITVNFTPSYDKQLIKAIQDDRCNYVTAEASYPISKNYSVEELEIDDYVKSEIINTGSPQGYHYVSNSKALVSLQNIIKGELHDPIDIMRLIEDQGLSRDLDDQPIDSTMRYPYIYNLTPDGVLQKLYIFQKGFVDDANLEKNFTVNQKLINIVFVDDLNSQTRFVIDKSNGITIKLNINNPMIRKYMTNKNINDLSDFVSIRNFSSTQSIIFMKELLIDVLTQLVVTNDIESEKLILDSTNINNAQKIFEHKNKIQVIIEKKIDTVFQKYIDNNIAKKINDLNATVDMISSKVLTMVDGENPVIYASLRDLSVGMKTILTSHVE